MKIQTSISKFVFFLSGILLSGVGIAIPASAEQQEVQDHTTVIVKFTNDAVVSPEKLVQKMDGRLIHRYQNTFVGASIQLPIRNVQALLEKPGIEQYKHNKKGRFIASEGRETSSSARDQTVPPGIQRVIDQRPDSQGNHINVAVMDSGVDRDHPDLVGNLAGGRDFVTDNENQKDWDDVFGHGTHVAGTVAAVDNDQGVVGVAPGASIYGLRVGDQQGPELDAMIAALEWMMQEDTPQMNVVNMSFSLSVPETTEEEEQQDLFHQSIKKAGRQGTIVVAAAGNENENVDASGQVPASYSESVTISAIVDTDGRSGGKGEPIVVKRNGIVVDVVPDDSFASFSNYGKRVDFTAPGVQITSTKMGGGTQTMSGTSMASPHAAGVIALYLSTITPEERKSHSASELMNRFRQQHSLPAPEQGWSGDPDDRPEPLIGIFRSE